MGEEINIVLWPENLKERYHFGDTGIDERIILRQTLRKWDVCDYSFLKKKGAKWIR
jgi:hypothetical protein